MERTDVSSPTGTALSVLIVDDDANFRRGIVRLFRIMGRHMGLRAHEAAGGQEAMDVLAGAPMDCVLLDYQMPGGDGLTWLRSMLEVHANLAVVMVTGHGDEQTAAACLKEGAMDYLVKGSITKENLRRAIMNAVEKIRMRLQIEGQRRQLLEAERQRVMIQSLGAACHHLGQPATTLQCYLELAKRQSSGELTELIGKCAEAADQLSEVIHRLQALSVFRSTPYLPGAAGEAPRSDSEILDVGPSMPLSAPNPVPVPI